MNDETTRPDLEPDRIRTRIETLLADLPDPAEPVDHLDELARRLEEAHNVLVRALESVEKG